VRAVAPLGAEGRPQRSPPPAFLGAFSVRRSDQHQCDSGAARQSSSRATLSLLLHPCLVSWDEVEHANRGQCVFPIHDKKRSALWLQEQILAIEIPGTMLID